MVLCASPLIRRTGLVTASVAVAGEFPTGKTLRSGDVRICQIGMQMNREHLHIGVKADSYRRPRPTLGDTGASVSYNDPALLVTLFETQQRDTAPPTFHSSHSSASSTLSPLVYLAGIDGNFQRP